MALCDHGVMSGALELYKSCTDAGITPFPGVEAYVCESLDPTEPRYHIGILALDFDGYRGLVKLTSLSHNPLQFHRKPRISLDQLMDFGNALGAHVALLTGCHFGMLMQSLETTGDCPEGMELLALYAENFPNLYVELQDHGITHPNGLTDRNYAEIAFSMAGEMGLPVILTQDSHYTERDDKDLHEMMKKLGYHTSDENEILFPGDSYHLCGSQFVKNHFSRNIWEEAQHSYADLLEKNKLSLPAMDNYRFRVPKTTDNPAAWLRRKAVRGLESRGMDIFVHYDQRMNAELRVIEQMGFSDYFLLISDIVNFANKNRIIINTRGSANGSLVCYALGITQVDPIEWGISFDRFLHPSRKKPPDIDMDVERDRRSEVIAYMERKLTVTPIGTFLTLGEHEDRGSVYVKYIGYKRRVLGSGFKESPFARIKSLWEIEEIEPADAALLHRLAEMEVLQAAGQHAAGYVLTDPNYPLDDYIPVMLIGGQKGTLATQMTMHDVESAGFVKVDLLGLAALTTLSGCLKLIGRNLDEMIEQREFDHHEQAVCKSMSTGSTGSGIFQFDGYSTANGAKQMGLKSRRDVINCLALFRPAAMKSGHTEEYLQLRKGKKKPVYLHRIFEKNTRDTFGVFVFQDQVIAVLRDLGLSFEDLNDMLTAVKASNRWISDAEKTFKRIKPIVIGLCKQAGMGQPVAEQAWGKIMDFSDYGFNLAHATSYGIMAYRMAWLKYHHPTEFMTATLQTWAGTDKEILYQAETRRLGIKIGRAHIQTSDVNWTMEQPNLIRKGLLSVKGIGLGTAEKIVSLRTEEPFETEVDVLKRCGKRVCDSMAAIGGLEGLPPF